MAINWHPPEFVTILKLGLRTCHHRKELKQRREVLCCALLAPLALQYPLDHLRGPFGFSAQSPKNVLKGLLGASWAGGPKSQKTIEN